MEDILPRLRDKAKIFQSYKNSEIIYLLHEAANDIDSLRHQLHELYTERRLLRSNNLALARENKNLRLALTIIGERLPKKENTHENTSPAPVKNESMDGTLDNHPGPIPTVGDHERTGPDGDTYPCGPPNYHINTNAP